jgi:hypothetical protein
MFFSIRAIEPNLISFNSFNLVTLDDVAFLINAIVDGGDAPTGLTPNRFELPTPNRGRILASECIPVLKEWIAPGRINPLGQVHLYVASVNRGPDNLISLGLYCLCPWQWISLWRVGRKTCCRCFRVGRDPERLSLKKLHTHHADSDQSQRDSNLWIA